MGKKRAYKSRKPGGGRKKLKPEYDAGKNLKEQMESVVALYDSEMSLQAIGEELGLNPIKVRKLLITAGVYESEVAERVQATLYYKIVVFKVPLQGLCYTVRDAVDWLSAPTARRFLKGSNHSSLQYC